jgi:TolB protein
MRIDRRGGAEPFLETPREFASFRLSPDGHHVAAQIRGGIESIWLFDIARGTPTRWTTEWDNAAPIWDLTGPQIIFTSPRPSAFDLYRQPVEGGNAERIVSSEFTKFPDSWSPDGTTLAYTEQGDIFTVRLVAGATPTPFANSEARERSATFSPSGAWVAYVSDESGRGRSVRATISRGRGAAGRYRSRAAPIRSGIQTERSSSTGRASE